MASFDTENIRLTDFVDVGTLQEIQDSFAAVAGVKASIADAQGNLLTQPEPTADFLRRQRALGDTNEQFQREGTEYVAPIIVNDQRLGTIRMRARNTGDPADEAKLITLAQKLGIEPKQLKGVVSQLGRGRNTRAASVQFLFLMANAIARLCYQEYQLRQRIHELTAVYNVAMMLAGGRDLRWVLQRTVQVVCEVMQVKAASLRLIDKERDELVIKAVYNLSREYLNKGPVQLSTAAIDQIALSPRGYEYVRNMASDPRVRYPQEAVREGIVSMLSVGLRYKGKPIGVLRVYTAEEHTFPPLRIDLMKAVAAQSAAAIENARLLTEAEEATALEKQVQMAAEVQQRMVPQKPPSIPGLELTSAYVPCFALGGDFYDFIPLPDDNLGLTVADVSGKGVPASLIMATVRAFLRAQVDYVYYLYEVVRRINLMLCRDTQLGEFVTLFYGVLDARTLRFTYCNAGHPAALLLRDGNVISLEGDNMVLGVNPNEDFKQSVIQLQKHDALLLYTDGLTDAMNFQQETFGRARLIEALKRGGESAEVIAQNILWEMRKFAGMAKRTDDVTLIVARIP
jgi:sigma-B regulation protein RsbU (phosphoserine phosphatase)